MQSNPDSYRGDTSKGLLPFFFFGVIFGWLGLLDTYLFTFQTAIFFVKKEPREMVLGICDGSISVSLVYVIAFTCLFW